MPAEENSVSVHGPEPKQKQRRKFSRTRWLAIVVPGSLLLFFLIFPLIARLSAQRMNGRAHGGGSMHGSDDPRKMEDIRRRLSRLNDSELKRDAEGNSSDRYVRSLLDDGENAEEINEREPDTDVEQYINHESEISPLPAEETQVAAHSSGEKEPSMMVYSRNHTDASPGIGKATEIKATGPEQMTEVVKSMGSAIGQLANPGERNRQEMNEAPAMETVIYNDLPPVRVFEGEFLEGVILNRVESQVADSPVVASVAKDYFDSQQKYVMIPAGSRVVGNAGTVTRLDQARMILAFHRIILPNGESFVIRREKMKGLSDDGSVGVASRVNPHFGMRYGHALLFGVLDGLAALTQNRLSQTSRASYFVDHTSANFNRVNSQIFSQYANILPSISVEAGHKVKIYMTEDILMSPYMPIKERGYAK